MPEWNAEEQSVGFSRFPPALLDKIYETPNTMKAGRDCHCPLSIRGYLFPESRFAGWKRAETTNDATYIHQAIFL
jgi:hypothetical protein